MRYQTVYIVFLGLVMSNYAKAFTYCKTNDPNFDSCLAKSVEEAVKSLKSGSSELGLKPIDPLPVGNLTFGEGGGAVKLIQYYDGVLLHGLSNIKVSKAHYDKSKKTLTLETSYPKITHQGHYKVDGAILALPVQGDGKATLELENCQINMNFKLSEITKGGVKYFKVISWKLQTKPKRMRMNFENLFNGNKLLGDNINKVINEEWDAIYSDVQPAVEKSYGEVFKNYAQEIFNKVPADKIFS